MAGRYAQQRLYAGGDPGSLPLRKRGTDTDPQPAAEEYDGVLEDLTARQVFAHKKSVPRGSNMEKSSRSRFETGCFFEKTETL